MNCQLNTLSFISGPLDQFEIRTLLSLDAPIWADTEITPTNIGLYLIIGVILAFLLNQLATNYYQIVSNN